MKTSHKGGVTEMRAVGCERFLDRKPVNYVGRLFTPDNFAWQTGRTRGLGLF